MSAFQGELSWNWDSRFDVVLADFEVDNKDTARATLERCLGAVWDSSSIGDAPDIVRTIAKYLGGLKSGQMLFASDPDAFIFCAWWPWGNGKTISIRVGGDHAGLSDSEKTEFIQSFKSWFGI